MHDCDSLVGPWKREVGASSRYLDLVDLFVVDVLVIDAQEDLPSFPFLLCHAGLFFN